MSFHSSVAASAVRRNEPARQVIATFDDYAAAERAVDYLAEKGFEVTGLAIVGRDLELVEQVTGRMNYGLAALRGACAGGLTGALIGWIFGLLNWIDPIIAGILLACYGLAFGAVVGALVGFSLYALQRDRHDFRAVSSLQPRHYDLVADCAVANEALRLLGSVSTGRNGRWQQQ